MGHSQADCREILSRLYVYIDGEVAAMDCAAIEQHLAECGPCFQNAEFERAVKQVIARKCGGEIAPSEIAERLRARLRELME